MLETHLAVKSVQGVTVLCQDMVRVRADGNICADANATVLHANALEVTLQKNLVSSDDIYQANIFLNLYTAALVVLSPKKTCIQCWHVATS